MEIETERLVLRPWRAGDADAFAAMNADPEVMEHFPATLTRAESDDLLARLMARWVEDGLTFAAVERKGGGFLGLCGLGRPRFEAHFTPCVEIGWRFARAAWGHGYATEAARAWLAQGFVGAGLDEIVAFTAVRNTRSRAVMERLGMTRDPSGDFDHPQIAADSPIRRHVLYRLGLDRWKETA